MKVNLERMKRKRLAETASWVKEKKAARLRSRTTLVKAAMARPDATTAVLQVAGVDVSAQPKSPRLRNAALLALARGKPCLLQSPICNRDPLTTVACHGAGVARGKGMGYKLSDFWTVWGCSECNHYTDAFSGATAEQKAAAFERGHERQVWEWRCIAEAVYTYTASERRAAQWALDHYAQAVKKEASNV